MGKNLPVRLSILVVALMFFGCPTGTLSTYTVTYDGNGCTVGSVPTDSNVYAEGSTVTVLGNIGDLDRTGCNFTGWNKAADGSGTTYPEGVTFIMGADVTLYAKWAAVDVTGVSLNKNSAIIALGNTEQLTATVTPTDAADSSVTWTSDNEGAATVDSGGLVTAVALGTATITVTTSNGLFTDNCSVEAAYIPGTSQTYTAGTVSFDLHYVPGTTFPTGIDDLGGDATVNSFWIGETEITYELWYEVRDWAETTANPPYTFANDGVEGHDGTIGASPTGADQEPVTTINLRDAMIWCNALTEYYNDQNGTDLSCAYCSDSFYVTPLRDSTDGDFGSSIDSTDGSFDQPYIKAATNGNTEMVNCTADGFRMMLSYEWELAARYIGDDNGDYDIDDPGEYYPGDFASGADRDWEGNGSGDIDGDGDEDTNDEVAVYNVTSTAEVKSKNENPLGLYDMSGNVWELCFDRNSGISRVYRGGSWYHLPGGLQVGQLYPYSPYSEVNNVGFRISRTP
jgi:uncharacterized repeat protein (TIGR02543 family)